MAKHRKTGQFFLWLIIGIMVVAMAGLGLNTAVQSSRSSTVFRVGKSEISQSEYYNALATRISEIEQEQGQPLSMNEARLLGIPDQVKNRLINQATLSEIARVENIRASDEAIGRELLQIEAFKDANGNFSRQNLELFLKNRGITEDQFIENIRATMERNIVLNILSGQTLQIDNLTDLIISKVGEKRIVSFAQITPPEETLIEPPTDTEIRALYDQDPTRFLGLPLEEYDIAYALPDPDAVAQSDIQTYYDENLAEFGQPAQVTYEVLTFPNEQEAEAFYNNPDYQTKAEERGLEPQDYLFINQSLTSLPEDLRDEVAQNGAGVYPPEQTLLGWNVYQITEYSEKNVQPLSEVENTIREKLAGEALDQKLSAEYETLSSLINENADPKTIAQETHLQFVHWVNSDAPIEGLTDQNQFTESAKGLALGQKSELIKIDGGGVFVLTRTHEEDAQPLPFEEVKEQIRAELINERQIKAQNDQAQNLMDQASNSSLEEIATANNLELITTDPVTAQSSFSALPLAISFEAFNRAEGELWVANDQEQSYIARIDEVIAIDPEAPENALIKNDVQGQVNAAISEGIIVDFLNTAAEDFGAVEYRALIEQIEASFK